MNQNLKIKFIWALGALTLIAVLVSIFYNPPTPLPQVVSSTPTQNSKKVNYFDNVKVKFNAPIDVSILTATSLPEEVWEISEEKGNVVNLKSKQYLQVDKDYTLNLSYGGKLVHSLSFKTIPQQSDPRYAQEVMSEIERDYPLSTKLPLETPGYSVLYSTPLNLEITLKNKTTPKDEVLGAVKAWVQKNGRDPDSHTYSFAN